MWIKKVLICIGKIFCVKVIFLIQNGHLDVDRVMGYGGTSWASLVALWVLGGRARGGARFGAQRHILSERAHVVHDVVRPQRRALRSRLALFCQKKGFV
jgi:hypothetical protein